MSIKAEIENYNKSTLEHLLSLDHLSNPKAAFGYFRKEQASTKHVTWESGKYKDQELTTFGFSCHSRGKANLLALRHEKNVISLIIKTQHN